MGTHSHRVSSSWSGNSEGLRRLLAVVDNAFVTVRDEKDNYEYIWRHREEERAEAYVSRHKEGSPGYDRAILDRDNAIAESLKAKEAFIRSTRPEVSVEFSQGRSFKNQAGPEQLVESIPRHKIVSLRIVCAVSGATSKYRIEIDMGRQGVHVRVNGPDENWVSGVAQNIKSELKNSSDWYQQVPQPLWSGLVALGILGVGYLMAQASPDLRDLDFTFALIAALLIGAGVGILTPRALSKFQYEATQKRSFWRFLGTLVGAIVVGIVVNAIWLGFVPG